MSRVRRCRPCRQVKHDRKIFLMLAWLNAFIGVSSPRRRKSRSVTFRKTDFLNAAALDKDLRLKILEVVDELDGTVRIRGKYR